MQRIYCDHGATAGRRAPGVVDAMENYLRVYGCSPGRGSYDEAVKAMDLVQDCRQRLAELVGADSGDDIHFVSNASHGLNIIIHGMLKAGDHVLVSPFEHNSVLRPLAHLESKGVTVEFIGTQPDGSLCLQSLQSQFKPNTRVVVVMQASNVTGRIFPIESIARMARARGIRTIVDGTQGLGHQRVEVAQWGVDAYIATGHKALLGPSGIGFVFLKSDIEIEPLLQGGTGTLSHLMHQPRRGHHAFEIGTMNFLGIAGLISALKFLGSEAALISKAEIHHLFNRFVENLVDINGVQVCGLSDSEDRIPLVSFRVNGLLPGEMVTLFDKEFKISMRSGLHCAPLAHRMLGTFPTGTVRASFGYGNQAGDFDALLYAISDIAKSRRQVA